MSSVVEYLFGAASFVPHGYCLMWRPDLVALHAVSDVVIAISYFAIPVGLWYFARQRTDLEFRGLFYLFASFILFCGLTHVVGLITLWKPVYGIEGMIKAATAIISIASAYALWPVIPKALAIPGLSGLRNANEEMARAIAEQEALVLARTAELTTANRELEAFASTVAHDLRTPLRSINGFSQELAGEYRQDLNGEALDMLNRIQLASMRMSALIDDLLLMSRVLRMRLNCSDVDISEMAETIVGELRASDPERSVKVAITQNIVISCDPKLMRIALTHLFSNCWKFTSETEQASIELAYKSRDGKGVLVFHDNGVGFDMAYADKLFRPFQRLHAASEFPGNGIGLAIAARIVNRHGGEVKAWSSLGKGTSITLELPQHLEIHDEKRSYSAC